MSFIAVMFNPSPGRCGAPDDVAGAAGGASAFDSAVVSGAGVFCAVRAGAWRFPQIEIENGRQLLRRGERDELSAIVQAVMRDDGVQNFRLEQRHRACQLWSVGDASEDVARLVVVRHGPAMIPASRVNKQS